MVRHENTIEEMSEGVIQLRQKHDINITSNNKIHYLLDRFFFNTISTRILQHQHC